ncbi:MAG TPA: TlpA disulfide reductase family protein [Terriglobia bacterium]|nr:TlpA disulfide reductase family protein [Terriglobia bacterium]
MSKQRTIWIAGILGAGLLGALFGLRNRPAQPLKIGSESPALAIPLLTAGTVLLRDDRHQVLVVNFWATWCPPCVSEAPSLEKFAERVKPLGVKVLGVSVDQDVAALTSFIATHDITFPVARDPNQFLSARFGTFKFPETYIFDRNGRLAEKVIGTTDWDDPRMIQFVQALADWKTQAGMNQASADTAY